MRIILSFAGFQWRTPVHFIAPAQGQGHWAGVYEAYPYAAYTNNDVHFLGRLNVDRASGRWTAAKRNQEDFTTGLWIGNHARVQDGRRGYSSGFQQKC